MFPAPSAAARFRPSFPPITPSGSPPPRAARRFLCSAALAELLPPGESGVLLKPAPIIPHFVRSGKPLQ